MASIIRNECLGGPDSDIAQLQCFEPLFERLITLVTSLAGMVFFVMLVVGGLKYMFSGGDPKKAEAAKGTLTAAFLGLVLIVSAYLILVLIGSFTGLDLTVFKIENVP